MSQIISIRNGTIPGSGAVFTLTGNTGGPVSPDGVGNIDVIADTGEGTALIEGNPGANSLTLVLTDADFNIVLGTSDFEANHTPAVGVANTGLGWHALDAMTDGSGNVGVGFNALASMTIGINNTAIGTNVLSAATSASTNIAVGSALTALDTGDNNIAIGDGAGQTYTTTESDNILIGNDGVIGDNNTIRIGTQGAGAGQQNTAFIAGIVGVTVANQQLVTINTATGQLGTTPVFAFNYTNVNFAMSPYTVLATDEYISVDTSGGAITLRFPNAATLGDAWIVKDRTGNAGTNNITVTTVGGVVLIDGAATFTMNTAFQAINLLGSGTAYEIY